jgi:hypothetical protein
MKEIDPRLFWDRMLAKTVKSAEPSRIEFALEMRTAQEIAPMSLFAFFEAFTVPAQLVQNLMSAVV